MSTELTWQTVSSSLEDTLRLAEQMGRKLKGGEVIELVSDLGGGKTAFVRGLAKGMGSKDKVHSPSFTLSNEYKSDKLTLHHFDFYRLKEPGIISNELQELLNDKATVVVVEWPGLVKDVLPADSVTVNIKASGEEKRDFIFSYPNKLSYLFPDNT